MDKYSFSIRQWKLMKIIKMKNIFYLWWYENNFYKKLCTFKFFCLWDGYLLIIKKFKIMFTKFLWIFIYFFSFIKKNIIYKQIINLCDY